MHRNGPLPQVSPMIGMEMFQMKEILKYLRLLDTRASLHQIMHRVWKVRELIPDRQPS